MNRCIPRKGTSARRHSRRIAFSVQPVSRTPSFVNRLRMEFATRLDHSIWYESPRLQGAQLVVLYSPGQNRAKNSDNVAAGESDCTGGNIPGSGGSLPFACNDGAFSDAISASLTWQSGPFYLVAAYERHQHVNRQSDLTG